VGAHLLVVAPGDPAPAGRYHDALDAALRGHPRAGRRGRELYATAAVGEVAEHHGALLVRRSADGLDEAVRRAVLTLVAVALLVIAAAVAAALVLARSVTRPLDRLRTATAAFGAGELSVRAGADTGPPEVVALAATFDDMAARIERLVRSQQSFVADASHQLRTPLTALRLRLESLEAQPQEGLDAALAETHRLSRLVDALLALARVDGGRPQPIAVDVGALLHERAEQWAPLAAEQEVTLEVADGAATAVVPDGVLEQVIDSYLDNALEVAPPGSCITLAVRPHEGGLDVVVTDEGPGLREEDRSRAFDRFWSRSTSGEGIGLGLAIVRQLVESAGGSAWLRPRAGGGTEAGVTVPGADS